MTTGNKETGFSDQEIRVAIKETIGKILMIEPGQIADNALLKDDLGMDSIDFLDVNFRLEEAFGIVLPPKNPIQRFTDSMGRDQFINDGAITSKGVRFLELLFPGVAPEKLQNILSTGIMSLVSIQTYVNLVKRCLEISQWKPEACGYCQSKNVRPIEKEQLDLAENHDMPIGPVYFCDACQKILYPPVFDEQIIRELEQIPDSV